MTDSADTKAPGNHAVVVIFLSDARDADKLKVHDPLGDFRSAWVETVRGFGIEIEAMRMERAAKLLGVNLAVHVRDHGWKAKA